jgi:20S proteasome alpha/beta subunit
VYFNSKLKYEEPKNYLKMTYILGSRCYDGVVIVSDTKFTISDGPVTHIYDVDKVTGEFPGFITAFSGERYKFERFRSEIREFSSTQPCQISVDRMLNGMSDIMGKINTRFSDGFELLAGISGAYFPDKKSRLKHFYTHGGYVPIHTYKAIGSEPFGKIHLRHWSPVITMEQAAELGFFVIKYIQDFNLDDAVGIDNDHPIVVRFIPDNPTNDKLDSHADDQMLKEFNERANLRLDAIRNEHFFDAKK